jgi:4,5-dihydroxyphthalate decarboxylase
MTKLTAAFTDNPRTHAVLSGAVPVPFDVTAMSPGDLFLRQLKHAEFDASELSMSSFSLGVARGETTWLALPVFTTREFFHTGILVHAESDLTRPEDLRGKRVGVLEYQQTAAVWIRGILEHEFGVAPHEMSWFMERRPASSHGGATGFQPPAGIRLQHVAAESNLAAMLMAGELDAIMFYPDEIDHIDDRSTNDRKTMTARMLFADPAAEAERYFAKTGVKPINHGVVVRRSLLPNDELTTGLYRALIESRNAGPDRDFFPYGLEANAKTLETLMQYLHEQGMTQRRVSLDELFAARATPWER